MTTNTLLDLLRNNLTDNVAERIGSHLGLSPEAARNAFQSVLPLQLDALTSHAQTQSGAQQLLDLASSVPAGSVKDVLERPGAFADLARLGNSFAPTLLGSAEQTIASKVNETVGVPASAVQNMGRLSLPLLLNVLLQYVRGNNINAGGLGSLLLGLRPTLQGMLPAGLAGLLGGLSIPALATSLPTDHVAGKPIDTVVAEPTVRVTEGAPVTPAAPVTPTPAPVTTERVVEGKKGGFAWWWLLPLLLLIPLLRGCFNQPAPTDTTTTTTPSTATTTPSDSTAPAADAGSVIVEKPQADSTIPAAAFTMQGKGKAGDKLSIADEGQHVTDVTVGSDGNWSAEMPAPTKGQHTYTVQGSDTSSKAEFKVNVGDEAANKADTAAGKSATGENVGAAGVLAITEPKDGGSTAGGAFDLKGTGKAGDEVEIFEDGTSLGKATIGTDGTWSLNVPSPTAGAHKYEVKGPETSVTSNVTVGAVKATGQACAKDFTLSLKDGETVNAPFRFGGVGKGKSYTVKVERDGRQVGSKELPLDASCGYSYTSNPGKPGKVKYTVAETGGADAGTITLNVQ